MIHPDHRDLEPLVPRKLAQRREAVHRRPVSYHRMFRLGFQNAVLPPEAVGRPCCSVLPVQQHHVEVLGIGEFAQLVDLLQRIHAFTRGHLRHQPIAIPRNALQRHAEHPVHLAVRLSGLKEANAAVVGVADQPA